MCDCFKFRFCGKKHVNNKGLRSQTSDYKSKSVCVCYNQLSSNVNMYAWDSPATECWILHVLLLSLSFLLFLSFCVCKPFDKHSEAQATGLIESRTRGLLVIMVPNWKPYSIQNSILIDCIQFHWDKYSPQMVTSGISRVSHIRFLIWQRQK